MDRSENAALIASVLLMALFFAALVYSATGLDIAVPTCVTDVAPFKEGKVVDKGDGRYELHMVAKMWAFEPAEVRLPPGADVDIYLSALDVTHGMYVERTNVNLMAVPGSVNAARVRFDEEGEYAVICHEYCGLGHHNMMGKIVVSADAVVAAAAPEEPSAPAPAGAGVFLAKGCIACHTVDGSPGLGPTMKGLFGRKTRLADGTTVEADEPYVEQAIRDPNAVIVEGFQPIMPQAPLTDAEVRDLMEYLKAIS